MGKTLLRFFRAAMRLAGAYARDKRRSQGLVTRAEAKARGQRGPLAEVWLDVRDLLRMLRAWASGEYSALPWKSLVMGLAAALYFVNPADAIPDILPLAGLLDDVAVLAFVLRALESDLARFREWQLVTASRMAASL